MSNAAAIERYGTVAKRRPVPRPVSNRASLSHSSNVAAAKVSPEMTPFRADGPDPEGDAANASRTSLDSTQDFDGRRGASGLSVAPAAPATPAYFTSSATAKLMGFGERPDASPELNKRDPLDPLKEKRYGMRLEAGYVKLDTQQQKVLKAIRENKLAVLKRYAESGVPMNFNDDNPLREAVLSNRLEILKYLHSMRCVNLNGQAGFAIRWAARKNYIDMVEWLCKQPEVDAMVCNNEAVNWATSNYNFTVTEILEKRIKEQEIKMGKRPGSTLQRSFDHRRRLLKSPSTSEADESFVNRHFEVAQKRASLAGRKGSTGALLREPSFRIPKDKESSKPFLDITRSDSPDNTNSPHVKNPNQNTSFTAANMSFNASAISNYDGSEDVTVPRGASPKFAAPQVKKNQYRHKVSSTTGLPLQTPRTRLKSVIAGAESKLGCVPAAPMTAHRRKVVQLQKQEDSRAQRDSGRKRPRPQGGRLRGGASSSDQRNARRRRLNPHSQIPA